MEISTKVKWWHCDGHISEGTMVALWWKYRRR